MIAPCGINCGTCLAFQRKKNKCLGCFLTYMNKPPTRLKCKIRNCEWHEGTESGLCFECNLFPCAGVKRIDKRYRDHYKISLIQNLTILKERGMTEYLELEAQRWTCPGCGSVLSVHQDSCMKCGLLRYREIT